MLLLDYCALLLARTKARHALIGGAALAAHGCPRNTLDVDYLLAKDDLAVVHMALIQDGFTQLQASADVACFLRAPIERVDFVLAHRPLALDMLHQAQRIMIGAHTQSVASVEDLIGLKLQAVLGDKKRSFQHQADIDALVTKHQSTLDEARVRRYYQHFQREHLWDETIQRLR